MELSANFLWLPYYSINYSSVGPMIISALLDLSCISKLLLLLETLVITALYKALDALAI